MLHVFEDLDWTSNASTKKSTSEFCFNLDLSMIS